jgi:hypothetical protein
MSISDELDTNRPSFGAVESVDEGGGLQPEASRICTGRVRTNAHASPVTVRRTTNATIPGRYRRRTNGRPSRSRVEPAVM